nr:cytochrome P450 6HY4 [Pagiophloeus tsushimanus]
MAVFTAIAVLGIVSLLYFFYVKWRQQYWARKGVPQLEPNVLFGDQMPMVTGAKSLQDFFLEMYQQCKAAGFKHVGIYNTFRPEYVPLDLNIIKLILTKDFVHFGGHGVFKHKNDPLTMHMFNLDGKEWKDIRTKLTPIFTTGKMKMMFETLLEKTVGLNKVIAKHISNNEPIHIKETLARFTTDIIGSVAFGLQCDTLNEPNHKFREIGRKAIKPVLWKFLIESVFSHNLLGNLGYHSVESDVESYFTKIVTETINYRENNNVQRKDFMQLMLQLKNQGTVIDGQMKGNNFVNTQEIINEAFLFYLAGFETSSSTMTFALFELARNPDIQEKLRTDILTTLEKHGGNITYDAVMEMEYLDKVIKEALRRYPVVSMLPRICTKKYTLPDSNIVIEKGTRVHIPIIGIQMDPEYYPNPERFDPENFSPENKAKRPDFTWIPFGEGPRQCIGLRFGIMQSKVGIVSLLKDFRFTLDATMKPPYEADTASLVYMFKKDLMLKATKL